VNTDPVKETQPTRRRSSVLRVLSPANIGAIYVWVIIIVFFSIIVPDTFPTSTTAKSILNQYSITGLVALSLVVPLAASHYDLSIGFIMGLSGMIVVKLLTTTALSPAVCIGIALVACVVIGLVNAFVVIGLGVHSFIGTLGTGAILSAITIGISNNETLTVSGPVGKSFSNIANADFLGLNLPVLYLLIAMIALAYWLERTKTGRYMYAVGYDEETSRLTGLPVNRLGVIAFLTSALLAGVAGIVLASRVASASPEVGSAYLIPAFSAAFLGATQFRRGRFNPWGTVIAVMLIGTGDVGLLLAGGPVWTSQLFQGVVLVAAVALTGFGKSALHEFILSARVRSKRGGSHVGTE
jgi:ribose transport system permease protein